MKASSIKQFYMGRLQMENQSSENSEDNVRKRSRKRSYADTDADEIPTKSNNVPPTSVGGT